MKFVLTERALHDYRNLSSSLQARVDKQLALLLRERNYPSLHAKKYDESRDIWQARVSRDYRFYFLIEGDTYKILFIIPHPK